MRDLRNLQIKSVRPAVFAHKRNVLPGASPRSWQPVYDHLDFDSLVVPVHLQLYRARRRIRRSVPGEEFTVSENRE